MKRLIRVLAIATAVVILVWLNSSVLAGPASVAHAPQGQWSEWYNLPCQPGKLSTAQFETHNPNVIVAGEIKFVNFSGKTVTLPFFNKQAGFGTNSQVQVRFKGVNGATNLNVWTVP